MKKILIIARREFIMTVTRKAYIFSVIGVPLFFVLIGSISGVSMSRLEASLSKGGATLGIIDRAGVIDFSLSKTVLAGEDSDESGQRQKTKTYAIKSYEDLDAGLRDLRETRLKALYVIKADYRRTGRVEVYTRQGGLLSGAAAAGRSQLYRLLRASLLQNRVAGQTLDRVLSPAELKRLTLAEDGRVIPPRSELEEISSFILPFGLGFLLTFAIFLSAGYLLQTTVEEKENRVIEIVLSSVKPEQLLWGKVLGLGTAAFLQVVIYLVLVGLVGFSLIPFIDLKPVNLLMSLVYCVLGYLLFASLLAATGIIGGNLRESSQLSTIWTLTAMIPFMLASVLLEAPNGTVARGLSYIPLTAPVTMILRLSVTSVPVIDIAISAAVLIGGIYLAVRAAAKLFRAASLMYGKRPTLPVILRWLREA